MPRRRKPLDPHTQEMVDIAHGEALLMLYYEHRERMESKYGYVPLVECGTFRPRPAELSVSIDPAGMHQRYEWM